MDVPARRRRRLSQVDTQVTSATMRLSLAGLLAALLAYGAVAAAASAEWPVKPIRMIVPFPPGGGTDLVGRAASNALSAAVGQPVVVDNRGGAGGIIGTDLVAKAAADGYTLGIATSSTHPVAGLTQKIPYDALKSFAPVTQIGVTPYIIVAAPALPANTLAEFVAYLKANPGKVNIAHVGTGTLGYLLTEAFKSATGTDMVPVPFKGSALIYPDLASNRVQAFFDNPVASVPLVKAGRLKAIAVTQRTPLLPSAPTLEEAGLKGFAHGFWYGIAAPAGTPRAAVERVARVINAYANSSAGKNELAALAVEPVGSSPAEFTATIRDDIERWGKVARAIGLKPQ